jgi:hypothetical protein
MYEDFIYEYEYNDAGIWIKKNLRHMLYDGDMLSEVVEYVFIRSSEFDESTGAITKEITYEKDGSYTVKDNNVTVDDNGVICSRPMIYVYDKNGELIETRDPNDLTDRD